MGFLLVEYGGFFFWQPGAPVLLDGSAAGRAGAAAFFHGNFPVGTVAEYTNELSAKHIFSCLPLLHGGQTEFLAHKSRGPLYSRAFDIERIIHCNLSRATSLSSA